MALLNKLSGFAKNIGDKASEAIETTKLNSKISSEKNAAAECLRQIGEYYYEKYQAGVCDPDIAELCAAIDGHNKAIADTQAEIARIQAETAAQTQARTAQAQASTAAAQAQASPAPAQAPAAQAGFPCPSCGAINPPDTKFCAECGAKVERLEPQKRICPECGVVVTGDGKFCGDCGAKVE